LKHQQDTDEARAGRDKQVRDARDAQEQRLREAQKRENSRLADEARRRAEWDRANRKNGR
jgi:hypothetical protein